MARLFPARFSEALDKTPMSELTRALGSSASHSKHGRQRLERMKRQDVPLLSGESKAAHMAAVVACSAGAATPAAPSSDAERFILRSFTAAWIGQGFRVSGFQGFRVYGLRFRVQILGFRVEGFGFRV